MQLGVIPVVATAMAFGNVLMLGDYLAARRADVVLGGAQVRIDIRVLGDGWMLNVARRL